MTRKILQDDINTMLQWADKWQLEFHPDKCVSMAINNKDGRKLEVQYERNRTQNSQDRKKDIGVIVDDQFKV